MGVKDYDLNPDNNTQINGINIAEGCPPSGINNAIRQLMADVKADSDAQNNTASTPATSTSLGPVMPQTGDEDGLELGEDGSLRVRKATATQRGSVLASVTALAGAVPLGGTSGYLNEGWLKPAMDAAESAASAAEEAIDGINDITGAATWEQKSTRSTIGQWTITGCRTDKPLIILSRADSTNGAYVATIKVISGAVGGDNDTTTYGSYALGRYSGNDAFVSTNCFICFPTSDSVIISIGALKGTLIAIQ